MEEKFFISKRLFCTRCGSEMKKHPVIDSLFNQHTGLPEKILREVQWSCPNSRGFFSLHDSLITDINGEELRSDSF